MIQFRIISWIHSPSSGNEGFRATQIGKSIWQHCHILHFCSYHNNNFCIKTYCFQSVENFPSKSVCETVWQARKPRIIHVPFLSQQTTQLFTANSADGYVFSEVQNGFLVFFKTRDTACKWEGWVLTFRAKLFLNLHSDPKTLSNFSGPYYIVETHRQNSFPYDLDDKESACNEGDLGLISGLGRFPGQGNGNPLQSSCLENPMDGGAWEATVHGVTKSRTRLSHFTLVHTDKYDFFLWSDQCITLNRTWSQFESLI